MSRLTKAASMQAPLFSNDKIPYESHCVSLQLPVALPCQCQAGFDLMFLQVAIPDFAFGGWPEAFLPPWASAQWVSDGISASRLQTSLQTRTVSYTYRIQLAHLPRFDETMLRIVGDTQHLLDTSKRMSRAYGDYLQHAVSPKGTYSRLS